MFCAKNMTEQIDKILLKAETDLRQVIFDYEVLIDMRFFGVGKFKIY
jgi:hypothetical protein